MGTLSKRLKGFSPWAPIETFRFGLKRVKKAKKAKKAKRAKKAKKIKKAIEAK